MLRAIAVIALALSTASPAAYAMTGAHQHGRLDLSLPGAEAGTGSGEQMQASRSMGSKALPQELRRRRGLPVHRIAAASSVDSPASRFRRQGIAHSYLGIRLDARGLQTGFDADEVLRLLPDDGGASVRVSPADDLR